MKFPLALATALLVGGRALPVSAQQIVEFPVPPHGNVTSFPHRITAGPDGNLWFTNASTIGRITTGGTVTNFPISAQPYIDIAPGPDGNLWFTIGHDFAPAMAVGRITPEGRETIYPLQAGFPVAITAGPDGAVWFAISGTGAPSMVPAIGRITTSGVITEFHVPDFESFGASGIALGPDGNLWFTGFEGRAIGVLTPDGAATVFPLPPGNSAPQEITAGPDGNLWFTQREPNRIGRITPLGIITLFETPTAASGPNDIVAGPDGALWFTESAANKIGRISVTGAITEFEVPTPSATPSGITAGPDGNIWFTESAGAKIGRLSLPRAPAIETRILPVVGSTQGVGGTFFRTSVQLHNPTSVLMAGRIVFHPSGLSGSDSDPALSYTLSPGQTQSIADLLPAMGRSGLGSADVEVTSGSVPAASARVFNDAGAAGTTGFTEQAIRSEEALRPGQSGVLLLPADLTGFRFNLGVRTLEEGAAANLTLRDASGAVVAIVPRGLPGTYHEQQSAAAFLGVATLPAGGSISISVTSGAAIFYGATVDNVTGDPSLQIARAAP